MDRGIQTLVNALALLATAACGSGPEPHRFPTTTKLPDEPRRAPGVAVDPSPGLPRSAGAAKSEQSVVVLRTPADAEQAREVVRRFFRAVLQEESAELEGLIAQEAWSRSTSRASNDRARSLWRARLARLDYGALRGQLVYRDTEMETYREQDLERLQGRRSVPLEARGDDVVVRVPISVTGTGRVRLFGDEIWFLLRPQPDGYRIVELVEDFRLP